MMRCALADISLAWDPNTDPSVTGYRLHSGTASGVYTQTIEVGNSTATVVSNLVAGQTYYFAVTAYNSAAVESAPSNEVSYSTPAAPTPTPPPNSSPTPSPSTTPKPAPTPPITMTLSASSHTINMGGTVTFTLTTSTVNSSSPTVVGFLMRGLAHDGVHYVLDNPTGQFVIPAGASSANVTLTALVTNLTSGREIATMKLARGSGYKLSKHKRASVAIMNSP